MFYSVVKQFNDLRKEISGDALNAPSDRHTGTQSSFRQTWLKTRHIQGDKYINDYRVLFF